MEKAQIISNLNLGGIGDSEFQGVANSMYKMQGLDIHSEPGIIKMNQAMKLSFNTSSLIIQFVACSDGNVYCFGADGKVYKKSDGSIVKDFAVTIYDAMEFNGYIYFALAGTLGRWQVGTNWSTAVTNFGTFTKGDTFYHPMWHLYNTLYIGDTNLVAQVDKTNTFTASALDIQPQYRIKTLGQGDGDLLIGATYIGLTIRSECFRWNTYSVSYTNSDMVFENGINALIPVDNYTVVQAWEKGNIYTYNGVNLMRTKRIPGKWSSSNGAEVKKNASANLFGLPMFGMSNNSGNPVAQWIYSYGWYSSGYPDVLNLEYILSHGSVSDVVIGAMVALKDTMLVSWSYNGTFGIDEIDWTKKVTKSLFETRKISLIRLLKTNLWVKIPYRINPASIKLFAVVDDSYEQEVTMTDDKERHYLYTRINDIKASSLRLRVELYSDGNTGPEVEFMSIEML
jgi:hypothetical protein